MIRKLAISFLFVLVLQVAKSQNFTIRGILQEQESQAPVTGATLTLQGTKNTGFFVTVTSDSAGVFTFNSLSPDSFILKISSIGFENLSRSVKVDSADVDLGVVILPKTSKELTGVTVQSTTAPATQKGDTLQINASQYKVNPDASTEDLVRKMPGITVENGQVKANGEVVQKVTIDGRELFGDDATAALRNLPAEIVDKIQVFDRLSDQAQASGIDDGNSQRGINIVTKANMRNGQFGRVYAGYGTDDRYQAGGNATILKDNRRISLVANFNNINLQNFSQQDLLGVTSQGRGGGRGGPGGGGGNFGGGNWGGGGGNFRVGEQAGINRTNAVGVNFSDIWGKKLTVTGSYFFNDTKNETNQFSNTQYFSERLKDNTQSNTSESNNTNHRANLRMEWKLDSMNTIIFTPNVSFQDNNSLRDRTTTFFNDDGSLSSRTVNETRNNTNGYNLNNSLLYRRSFAKRGRSFSINFNTSYNKREGESFIDTKDTRYIGTTIDDSVSNRLTDQFSDGLRLSTNINYSEPLSAMSQLQFSYNPSYSKNTSDQEAFEQDPSSQKYSKFLQNFSNQFENITTAHNAGLTYRWGDRDRQISFGVNYQTTELNSDQTFPNKLSINKSFSDFLPNAMIRYKLSPKSSVRVFYRTRVNQPSINQLQNVFDPNEAPFYTIGNPNLEQQYDHTLSTQYTYTNTPKGIVFVGNVFLQKANNYITNAIYDPSNSPVPIEVGQVTMPINLNGYSSLRSFLTFAVPLKFIKSNLNLNTGFTYNTLPGFADNQVNETRSKMYSLGSVISSNISQYVDFTVSYSANFNDVSSNAKAANEDKYFFHNARVEFNLLTKNGWFVQNDLNNQLYNGLSAGVDQNYFLWNAGFGKKFLKDRKGELRFNVYDILKQNISISREVNANYIQDITNQVLTRYFMLTFTYNLRNFGTAAQRAANNEERRMQQGGGRMPGGNR